MSEANKRLYIEARLPNVGIRVQQGDKASKGTAVAIAWKKHPESPATRQCSILDRQGFRL